MLAGVVIVPGHLPDEAEAMNMIRRQGGFAGMAAPAEVQPYLEVRWVRRTSMGRCDKDGRGAMGTAAPPRGEVRQIFSGGATEVRPRATGGDGRGATGTAVPAH
jgi:hypothetical protein